MGEASVNAAGLWAKQMGGMASIELPVSILKHHYPFSELIPLLSEVDVGIPVTVVFEVFSYQRQDQKGVLLGIYEIEHERFAMDRAPCGVRKSLAEWISHGRNLSIHVVRQERGATVTPLLPHDTEGKAICA